MKINIEQKKGHMGKYQRWEMIHLKRVMSSLKPKISMAAIAHGGGNQLLLRLLAS